LVSVATLGVPRLGAVNVDDPLNVAEPLNVATPVAVRSTNVAVPVNVGLMLSDLLLTAVAMLLNSVSISVPRTILSGLPEGRVSFVAKFVDFV
jgi:hypothetical protein